MEEVYDGKSLARCFELASKAWNEIDALCQLLDATIEKELQRNADRNEPLSRAWRYDDGDWIATDVAKCFGLISFRKKIPTRYLGYQISVLRDGMEIAQEPLVHLFHWGVPIDFLDGNYVGFPLDKQGVELQLRGNHLIVWADEEQLNSDDSIWMFSVRLTAINSEDDVNRIVSAMLALRKGPLVDDKVLDLDQLPGIVSYRVDDHEFTLA